MEKEFIAKHREYSEYLRKNSKGVDKSDIWTRVAPDFITEIVDGKPVMDNIRKRNYFLKFSKDPGISLPDKTVYYALKALKLLTNRFLYAGIRRSKRVQARLLATKMGYYDRKAKYSLADHPIFGLSKCIHDDMLYFQWHNLCIIYPHIKDIKNPRVLEIGAGSNILTMLLNHDMLAKCVIIDLPEMISFATACVKSVLPNAKILFPHEADGKVNFDDYDFVFLWPNQDKLLPDDQFDLAVNVGSFCEMDYSQIGDYFKLVQRVVKKGGFFYCSNRIEKNIGGTKDESSWRYFFKYPWDKSNVDCYVDINRYRVERAHSSYTHLFIDRLQKIAK